VQVKALEVMPGAGNAWPEAGVELFPGRLLKK